jgi:Domain of unknown function (DUF1330)
MVLLEFPSRSAAVDWYNSDAYKEIRKIRQGRQRPAFMWWTACSDSPGRGGGQSLESNRATSLR